jgi:hypothetical protein
MINFTLTDIEEKSYHEFYSKHTNCFKDNRSMTSPIEFIITPTSLGIEVMVKCIYCGEVKNITEYDKF